MNKLIKGNRQYQMINAGCHYETVMASKNNVKFTELFGYTGLKWNHS